MKRRDMNQTAVDNHDVNKSAVDDYDLSKPAVDDYDLNKPAVDDHDLNKSAVNHRDIQADGAGEHAAYGTGGEPPDHRRLGRALGLFGSDPLIGAGLPYWLPDGAAARHAVESYIREVERLAGYQHVYSPVLGKRELYELSGHWEHYRDDMYPPMDVGGEQLLLRPSLCPHHALIYRSRGRSHRELPLRIAETGGMYRSERSGVLGGLTRVRAIQLNDAHVFCSPDQVAAEVSAALDLVDRAYDALGIHAHRYRLALRGDSEKYVADPARWDRAERELAAVLDARGMDYDREAGEAAFYGPKIDVQVLDPVGREATLSTVQLDFVQPERFDLTYVDADGARNRPVMVHRGVVGSLERLFAHLVEVHRGAFPAWFAPVQAVVLPVGEEQEASASSFAAAAVAHGLRAQLRAEGSLGSRVRDARLVPFVVVIGPSEAQARSVSMRRRGGGRLAPQPWAEVLDLMVSESAAPL